MLDLLARGKISIGQAVEMLDRPEASDNLEVGEPPVQKVETGQVSDVDEVTRLKVEETAETGDTREAFDSDPTLGQKRQPRWLRVRVTNRETGKNKVTVNVPMSMVKFGLGIARVLSPEMSPIDLEEFGEMFNEVESGLLVDVQDDESNEQVRIIVE